LFSFTPLVTAVTSPSLHYRCSHFLTTAFTFTTVSQPHYPPLRTYLATLLFVATFTPAPVYATHTCRYVRLPHVCCRSTSAAGAAAHASTKILPSLHRAKRVASAGMRFCVFVDKITSYSPQQHAVRLPFFALGCVRFRLFARGLDKKHTLGWLRSSYGTASTLKGAFHRAVAGSPPSDLLSCFTAVLVDIPHAVYAARVCCITFSGAAFWRTFRHVFCYSRSMDYSVHACMNEGGDAVYGPTVMNIYGCISRNDYTLLRGRAIKRHFAGAFTVDGFAPFPFTATRHTTRCVSCLYARLCA